MGTAWPEHPHPRPRGHMLSAVSQSEKDQSVCSHCTWALRSRTSQPSSWTQNRSGLEGWGGAGQMVKVVKGTSLQLQNKSWGCHVQQRLDLKAPYCIFES